MACSGDSAHSFLFPTRFKLYVLIQAWFMAVLATPFRKYRQYRYVSLFQFMANTLFCRFLFWYDSPVDKIELTMPSPNVCGTATSHVSSFSLSAVCANVFLLLVQHFISSIKHNKSHCLEFRYWKKTKKEMWTQLEDWAFRFNILTFFYLGLRLQNLQNKRQGTDKMYFSLSVQLWDS